MYFSFWTWISWTLGNRAFTFDPLIQQIRMKYIVSDAEIHMKLLRACCTGFIPRYHYMSKMLSLKLNVTLLLTRFGEWNRLVLRFSRSLSSFRMFFFIIAIYHLNFVLVSWSNKLTVEIFIFIDMRTGWIVYKIVALPCREVGNRRNIKQSCKIKIWHMYFITTIHVLLITCTVCLYTCSKRQKKNKWRHVDTVDTSVIDEYIPCRTVSHRKTAIHQKRGVIFNWLYF